MNVVVIILAAFGAIAGAWAAVEGNARVAGGAACLVGLAVLLPLVIK